MQIHQILIFRPWVPEWLARTVIFCLLMISLFSFALYSNPAALMGYYGVEPADVQYGMVLTYASAVTFLALDFRIVKYFSSRKYLLFGLSLSCFCSLACFYTKGWLLFLACAFIQGITCALICSIVLNLVFPRLDSARARVIGYTILYGGIQISVPFYAIYANIMLHFFDLNWIFYGHIILLTAIAVIVLITMNAKARFHKKIPLYQVDWIGYFFYTAFCLVIGYILIYGQQLGWFESSLIGFLTVFGFVLLFLFVIREISLKRPLINLRVFKAKNFVIGLLLLFVFYIFKGTTGLTYGYVETILGTDPLHIFPIWLAVIAGTALSMFVTARLILTGTDLILLIIAGFVIMGIYYTYMLTWISVTGETRDFIFPMFIYGAATGVLFVPIVSFTASSAPPHITFNVGFVGIFARFAGFCASMAINNQLQLFTKASVSEKIREAVHENNSQFLLTLENIQYAYLNNGNDIYTSKAASQLYFNTLLKRQILARASMDYYEVMLTGIVVVIVLILLLQKIHSFVPRRSATGKNS